MSEIMKYKDEDLEKHHFNESGKQAFQDYTFERAFWESLANEPTPFDVTEEREGWKDKTTGQPTMVEYQPEEYVLQELNRLFPGWWTHKMRRSSWEEVVKLRTALIDGYLMIPYITPSGTKVRKMWAIAGSEIKFKSDDPTVPLDIANEFKGARTEWIRIEGKWLGIGLDIYHQHITSQMRSLFEDRIRFQPPELVSYWTDMVKTLTTGMKFRAMLKAMPRMEQIKEFETLIPHFPQKDQYQLRASFWKRSNATSEETEKMNTFLTKMRKIIKEQFKKEI